MRATGCRKSGLVGAATATVSTHIAANLKRRFGGLIFALSPARRKRGGGPSPPPQQLTKYSATSSLACRADSVRADVTLRRLRLRNQVRRKWLAEFIGRDLPRSGEHSDRILEQTSSGIRVGAIQHTIDT